MTVRHRDGEAVAAAASTQHIIRRAREAGIERHDPLWPFVETLCRVTSRMSTIAAEVRAVREEIVEEMRRAHGRMEAQERLVFGSLVERTARQVAARRIAYAVGLMLAGQIGVWYGHVTTASAGNSASPMQSAGGHTAVDDAWWFEMRSWNDLPGALAACRPEIDASTAGKPRRYCRLPLWIEPSR